jgi:PAS domain S-box-containing protein
LHLGATICTRKWIHRRNARRIPGRQTSGQQMLELLAQIKTADRTMFQLPSSDTTKTYRAAVIGLLVLSVAALVVTLWVMGDFLREQEIVRRLIRAVPPSSAPDAKALAGELRLQFRLTALAVLNMVATGCAMVLLSRAYSSSQQSLRNIQVAAADILGSMDQAVITTDLEGTITSLNRRAHELLGISDSAIHTTLVQACADMSLDEMRRDAKQTADGKQTRDFELSHGSGKRTLRGSCQPLRDSDDREIGSVLQLRDVTEPLLVEQQMRRMERFMGLGSLAAGLHHEIKNPLAALSLHVQLLEEQLVQHDIDRETDEILQVLKSEITRVTGVLESFRNYAALEMLDRSSVDIGDLVRRLVALVAPQAREHQIEIDARLDSYLPTINADQTKIEQTVLNLLLNAIEAMPTGGTLDIRASRKGKQVVLTIRDTGHGIPENLRERVFDPYFSTKSHGTGMGLAVCEKIVRQHQGQLDLRPAHPGTIAELVFPAEAA